MMNKRNPLGNRPLIPSGLGLLVLATGLMACDGGPGPTEVKVAARPLYAEEMAAARRLPLGVLTDANMPEWTHSNWQARPYGALLEFVAPTSGMYTFSLTSEVLGSGAPAFMGLLFYDGAGREMSDAVLASYHTYAPRGQRLYYALDAGKTYYVQRRDGTCTDGADEYEDTVNVKLKVVKGGPAPDDQPNRARDADAPLTVGVAKAGRLDYLGDADFFTFVPAVSGRYSVAATGAALVREPSDPLYDKHEAGFFTAKGEAIGEGRDFNYDRGVACASDCPLLAGHTYVVGVGIADRALKGAYCSWPDRSDPYASYAVQLKGNYTLTVTGTPLSEERTWSFDSGAQGWTRSGFSGGVTNGVFNLTIKTGNSNPYLLSPELPWDLQDPRAHHFRIRMRNSTGATKGRIFFATETSPAFSNDKSVTFAIKPRDPAFTEYGVDMTTNALWPEISLNPTRVTRFRVHPADAESSGSVSIDHILLAPDSVRIQAETFVDADGPPVRVEPTTDHNGNAEVGYIRDGARLVFNGGGRDLGTYHRLYVRVATPKDGGTIEMVSGTLVGVCRVPNTGGWDVWKTVRCDYYPGTGFPQQLRFRGGSGYLFNVNWIHFDP